MSFEVKDNLFLAFKPTVPVEVICRNIKSFDKPIKSTVARGNRYCAMTA